MSSTSSSVAPRHPQFLAASDLLSVSLDLLIEDISYKWSRVRCGLLNLASLASCSHRTSVSQPVRASFLLNTPL